MPLASRAIKMIIGNFLDVLIKTLVLIDDLVIYFAILFLAVMWHDMFQRGMITYCQMSHTIATKTALLVM